jgi:hypothetical protein
MSSSTDLQETVESLASFPNQLTRLFECFPPERMNWTPPSWGGIPSERLTAIEQICHVLDVEIEGYKVRFERIRSELAPVLPDLPGEQMAIERSYASYDATAVLRRFADARLETIDTIRRFAQEELQRIGIFEGKRTTLRGMVHFLCSHDFQHLSGLQWLLGKLEQGCDVS